MDICRGGERQLHRAHVYDHHLACMQRCTKQLLQLPQSSNIAQYPQWSHAPDATAKVCSTTWSKYARHAFVALLKACTVPVQFQLSIAYLDVWFAEQFIWHAPRKVVHYPPAHSMQRKQQCSTQQCGTPNRQLHLWRHGLGTAIRCGLLLLLLKCCQLCLLITLLNAKVS